MVTLHVTRELARALKLPPQPAVPANAIGSTLGPWSLGLVHCRPAKLVVAVSPAFAAVLHAEGLALGLQRLTLVNALEAVAAQLLQIK